MDPVTAALALITELTKLATVVIESQPKDVQAELWKLYLQDLKWWRRFLKIDDDPPSA